MVYWKPQTVVADEQQSLLGHSASNQYDKVKVGDVLWIVTSEQADDLVLVGRQTVDRLVGQLEAQQITKSPDLWPADLHAITDKPEHKCNLNISDWASKVEFDGAVKYLPQGFSGQHMQAIRRLSSSGVSVLERLWARRDESSDVTRNTLED